ncbi:MAG: Hsp70 family protein [Bacteroidetes Order II. Incertae sedis bacterium]|jgi:molecular chaperone DnaK (HSP70)|nr:Hsp70 family protein [Bacteroidetes Order II. bacterium]
MSKAVLGIDFGTSTTLVSYRKPGQRPAIIPIGKGEVNTWIPSVAGIADDGTMLIGDEVFAENLPETQLIRSAKTNLFNGDTHKKVTLPNGETVSVSIKDIVKALIRKAIESAKENEPGLQLDEVLLGCPANWKGPERQRLAEIATEVGVFVQVDSIIDEPIAAGVSWLQSLIESGQELPDGRTLVFDYGGGTLDIAVLEVQRPTAGQEPEITVLSADAQHGAGDKLDSLIAKEIENQIDKSKMERPEELEPLARRVANDLKHELTFKSSSTVAHKGLPSSVSLTQEKLNELFEPQLNKAINLAFNTIKASLLSVQNAPTARSIRGMTNEELSTGKTTESFTTKGINYIVLAGGMSRIPIVKERLEQWFEGKFQSDTSLSYLEEPVARGLVSTDLASGLNVHRPGFDFYVEYEKKDEPSHREVIYEAFTPLYLPADTLIKEFGFGHRTDLNPPTKKFGWTATITCWTPSGEQIQMVDQHGIQIRVQVPLKALGKNAFKIFPNGNILIAGKRVAKIRIRRWPQIYGGKAVVLKVERKGWEEWDDPDTYHYNR